MLYESYFQLTFSTTHFYLQETRVLQNNAYLTFYFFEVHVYVLFRPMHEPKSHKLLTCCHQAAMVKKTPHRHVERNKMTLTENVQQKAQSTKH